ncbi:FAD synthase [Candidatus Woesearchaeota archaeon]|nr:FAD synthase [Candidatus Woesearchaeota archaeon]
MTTVMAFGSFDEIHPGHLYYLKRAKALGKSLIVVVARDSSIERIKKTKPKYNEHERLEHVRELPYVTKAVLGGEGEDHLKIVEEINPDIIALGYDHKITVRELKEELKRRKLNIDVFRIGAYKEDRYKSSKLK